MARKFVRYTGDTKKYPLCSSPNLLVKEQVYEVLQIINLHTQVNYVLRGLEGFTYPAMWFTDSKKEDYKHRNTYHGIAHEKPILGKRYKCFLFDEGSKLLPVLTSTVIGYERLSQDVFYVRTLISDYYISFD